VLRRVSGFGVSDSRAAVARLLMFVCVGSAVVGTLVGFSSAAWKFGSRATRFAALNRDDRAFAVGNSIIPDKQVLYEVRYLPRPGAYRVVTGPGPIMGATGLTRSSADDFARDFLMPRRPDPRARLVICLGCAPSALGTRVHTLWTDHAGSSVLVVGR
jgi:hypothetical protein